MLCQQQPFFTCLPGHFSGFHLSSPAFPSPSPVVSFSSPQPLMIVVPQSTVFWSFSPSVSSHWWLPVSRLGRVSVCEWLSDLHLLQRRLLNFWLFYIHVYMWIVHIAHSRAKVLMLFHCSGKHLGTIWDLSVLSILYQVDQDIMPVLPHSVFRIQPLLTSFHRLLPKERPCLSSPLLLLFSEALWRSGSRRDGFAARVHLTVSGDMCVYHK